MASKQPRTAQKAHRASEPILYTKNQLLGFRRYAGRRDLLTALLEEEKAYDIASVDAMIEAFMKGVDR